MAITDELREWIDSIAWLDDGVSSTYKKVLAIADRIDAEHESACAEAYGNGVMSVPIALDDSAWVKLPVDADGVPIHIGDVMWQKDRITKRACKAIMGDAYVMLDGIQGAVYAKGLTHYHAPTVEDVLREFADEVQRCCDTQDTIAEYAAKLRLAGEE